MKLIEQSHEIWGETPVLLNESISWIERAGRVCYRSEDKIVEGSGLTFVSNIFKRKHYSVIEHSNIVMRFDTSKFPLETLNELKLFFDSPFFDIILLHEKIYISGNWRAWYEFFQKKFDDDISSLELFIKFLNKWNQIIKYQDEIPTELKKITVEFITDRAVTHELVRHRPASYSQESQRYVRYGEINFIKPFWYNRIFDNMKDIFIETLKNTEENYRYMLKFMRAEEARAILPNCTATKIVVTASIPEWKHIFNLRVSKAAYPQFRNLLKPVKEHFIQNDWI